MRFAIDVKPAVSFEGIFPINPGVVAIDDDEPTVSFGKMLQPDMSVVANIRGMDGFYGEPITCFFPAPLDQETQRILESHDWCPAHLCALNDAAPPVGLTAFTVIAPEKGKVLVGKPKNTIDINELHFSNGHLSETFLREMTRMPGMVFASSLLTCTESHDA